MRTNQHLVRSIVAVGQKGGFKYADGEIIMPAPVIVCRKKQGGSSPR
jgi:hypothetical protein